jgi:F0F1-type ATP synthase membrane subunit b/b'
VSGPHRHPEHLKAQLDEALDRAQELLRQSNRLLAEYRQTLEHSRKLLEKSRELMAKAKPDRWTLSLIIFQAASVTL